MKNGIRIAAAASGPIRGRKETLLVIAIYREGSLEGVLSGSIGVDSSDSARKIVSIVGRSRFKEQVKLIALNGIALAGLNVVDIRRVRKELGTSFLILTRKKPHKELLIDAIDKRADYRAKGSKKQHVEDRRKKAIIEDIGKLPVQKLMGFYVQSDMDISKENKSVVSAAFEALRIAHLIANGVETGESKGRI